VGCGDDSAAGAVDWVAAADRRGWAVFARVNEAHAPFSNEGYKMSRQIQLVLILSVLVSAATPGFSETATYRLTVDNTWSESSHPGNFPDDAHFSWIGGGSHSSAISFWNDGVLATPGIVQMAENGRTDILVSEVEAAVTSGSADVVLNWQHWFCPTGTTNPSCGSLVVEFEMDDAFPLVTLVTMLGPTPDWFVGVSGLPLHDGNDWIDTVIVDLRPYDGGSRDQNIFELGGPLTTPPDPVSLITTQSGQLVGPGSLGTFRFELIAAAPVPSLGSGPLGMLAVALLITAVGSRRFTVRAQVPEEA